MKTKKEHIIVRLKKSTHAKGKKLQEKERLATIDDVIDKALEMYKKSLESK